MRVERLRSALAAEQEAGVAELDLKFYFVICINFISCAGEAKLGKFDRQGYLGIILIKYLQLLFRKIIRFSQLQLFGNKGGSLQRSAFSAAGCG
jgi:hypothetical protein